MSRMRKRWHKRTKRLPTMILLKEIFFQELIAYALKHSPNECCGYLFGTRKDEENIIEEIFTMNNVHKDPSGFFMFSPQEQLDAMIKSKEKDLEIVGIFHSHPHAKAYPSDEDLKYIYDARQSYCIISLLNQTPEIRSFRIKDKEIHEEAIKF